MMDSIVNTRIIGKNKYAVIPLNNGSETKELIFNYAFAMDILQLVYDTFASNQDIVILFDGSEGSGKSQGMRQVAYVIKYFMERVHNIEVPFTKENVHYTVEEYISAVYNHERDKGWIHLFDESGDELDTRGGQQSSGIRFVRGLRKWRKLNHVHLFAMPYFHDMNRYIALARTKFLVHVYKKDVSWASSPTGMRKMPGYYKLFPIDSQLTYSYYNRKLGYKYPRNPPVIGRFSNTEILSEKEVNDLLEKNLKLIREMDMNLENINKWQAHYYHALNHICRTSPIKLTELSKVLDVKLLTLKGHKRLARDAFPDDVEK